MAALLDVIYSYRGVWGPTRPLAAITTDLFLGPLGADRLLAPLRYLWTISELSGGKPSLKLAVAWAAALLLR